MKQMRSLFAAMSMAAMVAGAAVLPAQAEIKIVDGEVTAALTDQAGDADAGRKALINRKQGNCLACHAVSILSDEPYHGEVGPTLDGVADRYSPAQMRAILIDSKQVFEDSIMPSFHKTDGFHRVSKKFEGKAILTAQQVEDVIAFLMTLKEE